MVHNYMHDNIDRRKPNYVNKNDDVETTAYNNHRGRNQNKKYINKNQGDVTIAPGTVPRNPQKM